MYGWEGTLQAHAKVKNDPNQPHNLRHAADTAIQKIEAQLRDKKLMSLRESLIKASRAGDARAISNYTKQIRDYTGEDKETGLND